MTSPAHRYEEAGIDAQVATAIVQRHIDPALAVVTVRRLHGGMLNHVLEFVTDGQPAVIVAKITPEPDDAAFFREAAGLSFCREQTQLPVPAVYTCFSGCETFTGTAILMERIDAVNLAEARLSSRGRTAFQMDLAHHITQLHTHTRATYGPAVGDTEHPHWLDRFGPTMRSQYEAVREELSSSSRSTIERLLDRLDRWLPENGPPTLVHGDLWATNILVDDAHPDRPVIRAFIDGEMAYADPEYELAYLRLFHTASHVFFEQYTRTHALRPGFDRRCRVYWLNTMMLHVKLFGSRYVANCEHLAEQIRQLT